MESTNYPQIDSVLYSHHLFGLYCMDIVARRILSWSLMVAKGLKENSV